MQFNTQYLNSTKNKTPRPPSKKYIGVIWHETASNGDISPHDTLCYNLPASVGSSYDFLIARLGEPYQYLDYHTYTSWDSGTSRWVIDGATYKNWELNSVTLGVELDGRNDGTPVTQAQIDTSARLALFLRDTEGIPLDREHHMTHAEVATPKGRKTDPRGTNVEAILWRARELDGGPAPPPLDDRDAAWGSLPVDWRFGIPQLWDKERRAGRSLGMAVTPEMYVTPDYSTQVFERGAITYRKHDGDLAIGIFLYEHP